MGTRALLWHPRGFNGPDSPALLPPFTAAFSALEARFFNTVGCGAHLTYRAEKV